MADSKVSSTAASVDMRVARQVLEIEAAAIVALVDRLDDRFAAAVQMLDDCTGRVIVTGMGKSGIISRKIAATLASTGTPAFFLHPAEAVHGDLGVVQGDDVVVALSHSGETGEILRLLETIKRVGARVICLTGAPDSTLGLAADVTLDCQVRIEACPLNLVPTASTTAALALGDALAMTLLVKKGFREEDFASLHPGGGLGKRLLRVDRLMNTGPDLPTVDAGVITDGDLRRRLVSEDRLVERTAGDVMTTSPKTIAPSALAVQALHIMEAQRITSLAVVDDDERVQGVVHLHDLWRTELF